MTIKLFITNSKNDLLNENKEYILSFGDNRYKDYSQHHDYERKRRYLARHSGEDWSKHNILSPAFQ